MCINNLYAPLYNGVDIEINDRSTLFGPLKIWKDYLL